MKLNFRIIRKDITKEDWYDPEYHNPYVEIISMKCLNCDFKEEVDADIVLECFNPRKEDFPCGYCVRCNQPTLVPEDVYDQIKGGFFYDVRKSSK